MDFRAGLVTIVISALLIASPLSTPASADVLYDTLTDAIEKIEAQGYARAAEGRYAIEEDDTRLIWAVPQDTRLKIDFKYDYGTIQSGTINFGPRGNYITIRSQRLCAKFKVRQLAVLPGGAIDHENSDFLLQPPGPECRHPRSQLSFSLENAFALQIDPAKTLKGKVFSGSGRFHECPTVACNGEISSMPVAEPVLDFTLFTTGPQHPGFAATLRSGASINFPRSAGYVQVGQDSGVNIIQAKYDVRNRRGSGVVRSVKLTAQAGILNFGATTLDLGNGSLLSFDDLSLEQSEGVTLATRGTLTGALGDSSIISAIATDGTKSQLSLAHANAKLTGLMMEFGPAGASLSGASGEISATLKGADLRPSANLHLLLGGTNLNIILTCPGNDAACRPFRWTSAGGAEVIGKIAPFATSLRGGDIAFPRQNKLEIEGGDIQVGELQLDTRNQTTPITGKLEKLDIKFLAQNWKVDESVKIGATRLRATTQDLSVIRDDPHPVGALKIEGEMSSLEASGVGRFATLAANSKFEFSLSRRQNDDVKIDDGNVVAHINVRGDQRTAGEATFELRNLLLYRGVGHANLDFHLEKLETYYYLSAPKQTEGFSGGRTVVSVTPRDIKLALNKRLGFSDVDVSVNNGIWSIPDQTALPVEISVDLATGELVNVQVQLGGGDLRPGDYNTVCSPHVNVNTGHYMLSASATLSLGRQNKFSIAEFALSPAFDADVDERGCDLTASAICAIVGTVITGNPLCGIGLGLACGDEVDKYKDEMNKKIRNDVGRWISDLSLEATF